MWKICGMWKKCGRSVAVVKKFEMSGGNKVQGVTFKVGFILDMKFPGTLKKLPEGLKFELVWMWDLSGFWAVKDLGEKMKT